MSYSQHLQSCRSDYSSNASNRLEQVVNKFYINGDININNGIQHSIAAQRTRNIHVYNKTIDNSITSHQTNYVVNFDNRKIEFISPYIGENRRAAANYLDTGKTYLLNSPKEQNYVQNKEYQSMITTGLLKPRRPATQFIDNAEAIREITTETFQKLTGQPFPDDIIVRVCNEEEMKKSHNLNGGKWSSGIMGFALNRHPYPSTIFIRNNHLDELMLTVGHEIGHVISPILPTAVDEEAKAFAFELAWAKTIVEHDIGNLAANFNPDFMPAQNGLHDKAFAFVQKMVKKGKDALSVFFNIAKGTIKCEEKFISA